MLFQVAYELIAYNFLYFIPFLLLLFSLIISLLFYLKKIIIIR
jgi:hypothetical protein